MNPQLEELKQEIPYNNDTDLGDFLSRKGVEEYINRTWNLAMERASKIAKTGGFKYEKYDSKIDSIVQITQDAIANAINKEKV